MTGLFDGLGTMIILILGLLCYTPLITTMVLRETRLLDFVAAEYRLGGYVLIFLLLGIATLFLFSMYTLDGIFVFAMLNTFIFLYCRFRKLLLIIRKERRQARRGK